MIVALAMRDRLINIETRHGIGEQQVLKGWQRTIGKHCYVSPGNVQDRWKMCCADYAYPCLASPST